MVGKSKNLEKSQKIIFFSKNPILDTRISVRPFVRPSVLLCVTLRGPPLDSETGLTGELWSNPVLLILEN